MSELDLNKPAGVLVKTTCVDFPGRLAGSFFLKGCNIRCPYCYNIGLVLSDSEIPAGTQTEPLNSVAELFAHLEKRQGILSGLVISGGEPLLNPYTPLIIRRAKELGYKIKIDTNGTLPEKLSALISKYMAVLVVLVTLIGSIPAIRMLLRLRPAEVLHGGH